MTAKRSWRTTFKDRTHGSGMSRVNRLTVRKMMSMGTMRPKIQAPSARPFRMILEFHIVASIPVNCT